MGIDYQHLFTEQTKLLRFRSTKSGVVDVLLSSATGCVLGGIVGQPYLDVIVGMVPHRLEFDADVELRQIISEVRARRIPIHRDVEMAAVLVATCVLMVAAIAYSTWMAL